MTTVTPALAPPRWLTPARLDRFEQVTIVILWLLLAKRVFTATNPFAPLIMVAETAVVIFVLIRRPTQAISLKLGDWLLAITATYAPLLIQPADAPAALQWLVPLGIGLTIIGNVVQIAAKMFLRRSFGIAPANRGIKTDGLYRIVRHPMYAGYLLVHIGVLMLMPTMLNLVIYAIGWWAQILRLLAEERLLSQDPAYRVLMEQTRWRLIPGLF
ncbi:MAG: methyltransferase [Pseudomonadota bacterium]|nr:methyltransferase [Pseudomonadota bacterium]